MTTIPTTNTIVPNLPIPPVIDYTSRDFNSILNDLINAIPGYMPEWTDRSPGDFGMVLLELFAYFGDLLNYYIDRVANEAFLATAQQRSSLLYIAQLLDYTPSDPVASTTSLQFTIASPSPNPVVIPALTQVTTRQLSGASITFETDQTFTIWGDNSLPSVATQNGTGLAGQVVVIPGPWDGRTQTVTVNGVVWNFVSTLAGQAATAQVYTILGSTAIQFGDGTTGKIPPLGQVITVSYFPASGSQYSGTVTATQGSTVSSEVLGNSDGTANQIFTLFQTPVINDSVIVSINEGFGYNAWTSFRRLIDAAPTDRAFTTVTDSNGVVTVHFGDGATGVIPAPGASILATYRVGGGVLGNVAANSLVVLPTTVSGVVSVTNPTAAVGGADLETTDHIRTHAPLSFTAVNRAVTLQDFAALVLADPTVAKASASAISTSAVNIYVHPAGTFVSDQTPTGVLFQRVQAIKTKMTNAQGTGFLDTRIMAGTTVNILGPQYNNLNTLQLGYVPIDITVTIFVLPNFHQSAVQAQVSSALASLLSFANVDFGTRISLLSVYTALNTVNGVAYGQVSTLTRHETSNPNLLDLQMATYEIPIANNIVVAASGGMTY